MIRMRSKTEKMKMMRTRTIHTKPKKMMKNPIGRLSAIVIRAVVVVVAGTISVVVVTATGRQIPDRLDRSNHVRGRHRIVMR